MKYSVKKIVKNGSEIAQSVWISVERESKETKDALPIVNKMLSGKQVSKSEIVFLKAQSITYRDAGEKNSDLVALSDFCQVLFGLNEFVYVE